jgi:hypothetical protein
MLVAGAILASFYLLGSGHYGLAACGLFVAAFLLWWSGQPGPSLDQDFIWVPEERPAPKSRRRR